MMAECDAKAAVRQSYRTGTVGRALRLALRMAPILGLIAFAPPGPTEAATASTTFLVTANITVNCLISAAQLDFGQYHPLTTNNTTPLNGQSEITVTCTNTGNFILGLDAGQFNGATTSTRRMTGPSNAFLNYSLFSDAARTLNWGNNNGVDTVSGIGTGGPEILIVYGQVPAGQTSAVPGGYIDTITATITF